jgi:hypothetical protein
MDTWPESWAIEPEDVPVGRALVAELRPYAVHLEQRGLTPKTVRRHLNDLWVIGGEIIRRINYDESKRKLAARKILLDAIEGGEAPLASGVTEAQQAELDAAAKRLLRFMTAQGVG